MNIKSLLENLSHRKMTEQIDAPLLASAMRVPYGAFKFKATVAKGVFCQIEASTNFENWMIIGEQESSGEIDFVDTTAPNFSYRFYRLKAHDVRSRNIIGYAAIVVPPGFSMIANPFVSADDGVSGLFKDMPDGTSLCKFDTRLSKLTENKVASGQWRKPLEKLSVGEGALFFNPTSDYKTLNFFGDVKEGRFSVPVPAGFSIRSSMIPRPGRIHADLGFPASEGDVIHLFDKDTQKYVLYPYDAQAWASNPPTINVGESFWVAKTTGRNWAQSLEIE